MSYLFENALCKFQRNCILTGVHTKVAQSEQKVLMNDSYLSTQCECKTNLDLHTVEVPV